MMVKKMLKTEYCIVAGGCFWGVEYLMQSLPGVLSTTVGYTGGHTSHPTYEQVCSHATGHIEAVKIIFDSEKISYESIIKYFFEIHDPTQADGQGPDLGPQYVSCIFYHNDMQKKVAENIITHLTKKGLLVVTTLRDETTFWPAENYHQQYYEKNKKTPYCHVYTKRF
jgi:peptide methionine sulfoxide reductase msrA/msrB